MIVMIDNYDSFTFNLVQYIRQTGASLQVFRNDQIAISQLRSLNPERIVISPGPCSPNQAGISLEVIQAFAGVCPILGVCLGHQAIGQSFGGKIIQANRVMHGKTSLVHHKGEGVFARLPTPFVATRYHSLVIDPESLPECLEVTAKTNNERGEFEAIMGIKHRDLAIEGVQFHPESILTEHGHAMMANFLNR